MGKTLRRRTQRSSVRPPAGQSADVVAEAIDETTEKEVLSLALHGKLAPAAAGAVRRQVAKGIPITFQRGSRIVKKHPDGREEILAELRRPAYRLPKGVAIIRPAK